MQHCVRDASLGWCWETLVSRYATLLLRLNTTTALVSRYATLLLRLKNGDEESDERHSFRP